MKFKNFQVTCKKCGSNDVSMWIQMYDSCDNKGLKCDSCGQEESEW